MTLAYLKLVREKKMEKSKRRSDGEQERVHHAETLRQRCRQVRQPANIRQRQARKLALTGFFKPQQNGEINTTPKQKEDYL
ncbi:MAG: hypothetical protein IPI39_26015 [Candidatus Obscuribacter sp.]|nr:hypothetical protein [Candidatus Obscuribacter sp.]